jgi:hypothetical protein
MCLGLPPPHYITQKQLHRTVKVGPFGIRTNDLCNYAEQDVRVTSTYVCTEKIYQTVLLTTNSHWQRSRVWEPEFCFLTHLKARVARFLWVQHTKMYQITTEYTKWL